MANRRREDLQRAGTLLLIHRHRYGVRQAARILGVPRSTVMDWKRQGPNGIQHPRLRMIAQKAVDGLTLAASEENEVAVLFASRAEANKSAKDRAEADNEGKDPQEGLEQAGNAAENVAEDNSTDPVRGPGEPLPPATDENGVPLMPEDTAPPILDKLNLLAWHRYLTLLQNDVAHHHASAAASQIDPDFQISDAQAKRAIHALGKGEEAVKFASNWSAGTVAPPEYVQSVYEQFRWPVEQERELAVHLNRLAQENYLSGINDQLLDLGAPIQSAVRDQAALAEIRSETDLIAAGIRDTFDRDLAAETYTQWVELSAERGTQMSRRWLEDGVRNWALARAEWKAVQISITETGRWRTRGVGDFMQRNRAAGLLNVAKVHVEPKVAVCPICVSLVAGSPYHPDDPELLSLPKHVHCQHFPVLEQSLAEGVSHRDLWTGQGDAVAEAA